MNKYQKLIDLGLIVNSYFAITNREDQYPFKYVLADQVLKLIESGVDVVTYGERNGFYKKGFSLERDHKSTHTGLVIAIKELKPKEITITREELFRKLNGMPCGYSLDEIAKALGL